MIAPLIGAILIVERLLFSLTFRESARAIGTVGTTKTALIVAVLASLPMWAFLPAYAWSQRLDLALKPDSMALIGFIFGHLRRGRSFAAAATLSATVFAAQHVYIILTAGPTVGVASVMLAALLAYPMVFVFERGASPIVGPAILHTSSNAPAILFDLPYTTPPSVLVMHMGVILLSLWLAFWVGTRCITVPSGGARTCH